MVKDALRSSPNSIRVGTMYQLICYWITDNSAKKSAFSRKDYILKSVGVMTSCDDILIAPNHDQPTLCSFNVERSLCATLQL